ncbi:MAG TPA: M23 family metallopeptidase [Blastocatellia bacterium]|nr:M23 family metallopeptidase [Blastocatellia bacterium]
MSQDKRFYTFIFAPSANAQFRRINLHYNVIYCILGLAFIGLISVAGGIYSAAKYTYLAARYKMTQMENRQLREENMERALNDDRRASKLAMIETTSRKLAEVSGVSHTTDLSKNIGTGGPDGKDLEELDQATALLERELNQIKEVVDSRQFKLASTPSTWPVRGYVSDGFGSRSNPFGGGYESHPGVDIATTFGTAIEATADGVVVVAGVQGGYGNCVVIDHGYGVTTRYGHMSRIDVQVGERVHRGKQIGAVGSTGRSTGPHCHYEVRLHDRPVNPMNYLPLGQEQ